MKVFVFGSEGMGGQGILRALEDNLPASATIVRADKKLNNDPRSEEELYQFLEKEYYDHKDDLIIPLNTDKLSWFRDLDPAAGYVDGEIVPANINCMFHHMRFCGLDRYIPFSYVCSEANIDVIGGIMSNLTTHKEDRVAFKRDAGHGGRGFHILTTNPSSFRKDIGVTKSGQERWHFKYFPFHSVPDIENWVFQQYCNGSLFSVDVLFNDNHQITSLLMRQQIDSMAGITTVCKRYHDDGMVEAVSEIGRKMKLSGMHGFQFKHAQSLSGDPKLIDWNARFQSGVVFGDVLGEDIFANSLRYFINGRNKPGKTVSDLSDDYYTWLEENIGIYARRDMGAIKDKI